MGSSLTCWEGSGRSEAVMRWGLIRLHKDIVIADWTAVLEKGGGGMGAPSAH